MTLICSHDRIIAYARHMMRTFSWRATPRGALRSVLALACLVVVASRLHAQAGPHLERRELTIPMRDNTTLVAVALVPVSSTTPLPILLVRTTFNASRDLAKDGYIFVAEDIRGRNRSGGTSITNRAPDDPRNVPGTNESTDAFDTIDWLVKNVPSNNGRVGVIGTSYSGWLAGLAAVGAHPALKAISP